MGSSGDHFASGNENKNIIRTATVTSTFLGEQGNDPFVQGAAPNGLRLAVGADGADFVNYSGSHRRRAGEPPHRRRQRPRQPGWVAQTSSTVATAPTGSALRPGSASRSTSPTGPRPRSARAPQAGSTRLVASKTSPGRSRPTSWPATRATTRWPGWPDQTSSRARRAMTSSRATRAETTSTAAREPTAETEVPARTSAARLSTRPLARGLVGTS
jgi:hypothetical protein